MSRKVVPVAMNGVTGRMGYRQHLVRSLLSIRDQGGVLLDDGTVIYPEPILVGRSEQRLRAIAERHGLEHWTTSLDEVLSDPAVPVYFDAQVTSAREPSLAAAIAAGKHVYTEKPLADSLAGAAPRPPGAGAEPGAGHRGRQACLHREAVGRLAGGRAAARRRRAGGGHHARRRAGQAVPA